MVLLVYRGGGIWPQFWHLSTIRYSHPAYHVQLVERIFSKKVCPKRTFRSDFGFLGQNLFFSEKWLSIVL